MDFHLVRIECTNASDPRVWWKRSIVTLLSVHLVPKLVLSHFASVTAQSRGNNPMIFGVVNFRFEQNSNNLGLVLENKSLSRFPNSMYSIKHCSLISVNNHLQMLLLISKQSIPKIHPQFADVSGPR